MARRLSFRKNQKSKKFVSRDREPLPCIPENDVFDVLIHYRICKVAQWLDSHIEPLTRYPTIPEPLFNAKRSSYEPPFRPRLQPKGWLTQLKQHTFGQKEEYFYYSDPIDCSEPTPIVELSYIVPAPFRISPLQVETVRVGKKVHHVVFD